MLTRLIGDIHGAWEQYHAIASEVDRSIQVGDFGVGFSGPYWHERADEFHWDGQHRFIRGNHDDPTRCQHMAGWIRDGFVEVKDRVVMHIGGAWSIDYAWRTEGTSWWRDEELSQLAFDHLIEVYSVVKPQVMITHDCPSVASLEMFCKTGHAKMFNGKQILTRTGEALQRMFEIHQPEEWFFGHWHKTLDMAIDGTKFQCLGELEYKDVEL